MKNTKEHGLPKKEGWYWLFIPDFTAEIILCRLKLDKKKNPLVYEWHDCHEDYLIPYDIIEWKRIPKPKPKTT